jgi:hypothetical protein
MADVRAWKLAEDSITPLVSNLEAGEVETLHSYLATFGQCGNCSGEALSLSVPSGQQQFG